LLFAITTLGDIQMNKGYFIGAMALMLTCTVAHAQIPVGTIIAYAGEVSKLPANYIICDGKEYTIGGNTALYAAIGTAWGSSGPGKFNVPDLRGLFLRGVSTSPTNSIPPRMPDPDEGTRTYCNPGGNIKARVGSVEADTLKTHQHQYSGVAGAAAKCSLTDGNTTAPNSPTNPITTGALGLETRPKNAYVYYLIKVKAK
jgi:microcystin-dependent protein